MSDKNDGGPAFPRVGEGFGNELYDTPGMSLRDYFAAKAMQGSLAGEPGPHLTPARCAQEAYAMADEMLKAREAH